MKFLDWTYSSLSAVVILGWVQSHHSANASCPVDGVLEALTPYMPFGRPGAVYGDSLYTQYREGVVSSYPRWNAARVRLRVTSNSGKPVSGCKVAWDTGFGASNGWIFPISENHATGDDGVLEAFWTAGTAVDQEIVASIPGGMAVYIKGHTGGQRVAAAAAYQSFAPKVDWDRWREDIRLVRLPPHAYYALIYHGPMYAGIVAGRGILFTTWWNTDANPALATLILDPPEDINNATHRCHQCANCAEGYHASCDLYYTFVEGHEYRLELEKRFFDTPIATELSVFFSDLTLGGRYKVATMRYQGKRLDGRETYGFLEQFQSLRYTCLDNPRQYIIFTDVAYAPLGSAAFYRVDSMRVSYGDGCANVWYEQRQDGVHISTGGTVVGFPAYSSGALGTDIAGAWLDLLTGSSTHATNCSDGLKNGPELGVDCGGECTSRCTESPSCSDGIANGDEDYVDCGGSCAPCDTGLETAFAKVEGRMTWYEARAICKERGSKLAVIRTRYENRIANEACVGECWIGLSRPAGCFAPSCWYWDGGPYLDETIFNHWGYPGTSDIYRDDHTAVKLTQRGLGEWVPITKDSYVSAALCTASPVNQRTRVSAVRISSRGCRWAVEAKLFYDRLCRVPIILDDSVVSASSRLRASTAIWEQCAEEYETCACAGGHVRFGTSHGDRWTEYISVDTTASCDFRVLGDPAPGVAKWCECTWNVAGLTSAPILLTFNNPMPVGCFQLDGVADVDFINVSLGYNPRSLGLWSVCAEEWAVCNCSEGMVRFGTDVGDRWTEPRMISELVICSSNSFNDPAPGAQKWCQCSAAIWDIAPYTCVGSLGESCSPWESVLSISGSMMMATSTTLGSSDTIAISPIVASTTPTTTMWTSITTVANRGSTITTLANATVGSVYDAVVVSNTKIVQPSWVIILALIALALPAELHNLGFIRRPT